MPNSPLLPAVPVELPLLPLRDVVVFPHMVIPLFVGRSKSIKALEAAMEAGKSIMLVAQKSAVKDDPDADDLYAIGCIANILQMLKLPDGTVKVLVEGTQRARIGAIEARDEMFVAVVHPVDAETNIDHEVEALRLADLESLYQADAAQRMGISRQTFANIVGRARQKVAEALIQGKALEIALSSDLPSLSDPFSGDSQ